MVTRPCLDGLLPYLIWFHSIVGLIRLPVTQEIRDSNSLGTAKFYGVEASKVMQWTVNPPPLWHDWFDPSILHQVIQLSSRGLGHHPFTVSTGVQIPLAVPMLDQFRRTRVWTWAWLLTTV